MSGSISTNKPLLAVVGCGYWGKNLARNFNDLNALSAICESDENTRAALKQMYPGCLMLESYSQVLSDESIKAVAIATPAETHAEMVRAALLAGKDVFVEKPLALSVSAGRELVALARDKGRILMVGHLLWYHPAILKLKELVDAGALGRIQYIYSHRLNLGKIRREENILWSFAPHDVSVILGLVNEMPTAVKAEAGYYLHDQIADTTISLLSFSSGLKAHVFVSWLHPFKEQKLVVVGEQQMAVFDDVEPEDKLTLYAHSIDWKNHLPVVNKAAGQVIPLPAGEPLRAECRHFLDCLESRQTPRTDGEEGLRVLTVLQQCQEALGGEAKTAAPPAKYFAHESSFIDEGVEIGEGTYIWHVSHVLKGSQIGKDCRIGQNVVIGPDVTIGDRVKIQNNVSVYAGVTLEDGVFCGPSMVFTNVINPRSEISRMDELRPTVVKQGASLGANSTIICGISIGRYAFVGAGAVVLRDVPDFALVVGNPARTVGWMCVCGNRIMFAEHDGAGECSACHSLYRKEGNLVVSSERSASGS